MAARGKHSAKGSTGATAKDSLEGLLANASPKQKNFLKAKDSARVLKALHPITRSEHMSQGLDKDWIRYCFKTGCKANEIWQSTVSAVTMWNGANVFHLGAATGITPPLMQILCEFGDDTPQGSADLIFARTENYGWSVLHFAAKYGRNNEIRLFLKTEPLLEIDALDNEQRTPLHRAAMSICKPDNSVPRGVTGRNAWLTVMALLEHSADPNLDGGSPLAIAEAAARARATELPLPAPAPLPAVDAASEETEDGWTQVRGERRHSDLSAAASSLPQLASLSMGQSHRPPWLPAPSEDNDWDTRSTRSMSSPVRSGCRTPFMHALMTMMRRDESSEYAEYTDVLHALLKVTSHRLVCEAITWAMARQQLVGVTVACKLFLYPDSASETELSEVPTLS